MTGRVDVRRAAERFRTVTAEHRTAHAFSFGEHYDPEDTGFGLLVAVNDHSLPAGGGFPEHAHRDLEIVTWVLDGALEHRDSTGRAGVLRPGQVQRLTAGTGIRHSERATGGGPTRFLQSWLLPAGRDVPPGYAEADLNGELASGRLVPVASGLDRHTGTGAVPLARPGAALHVARLPPGGVVALPDAPYVHLAVPRGQVEMEGSGLLETDDAARMRAAGSLRLVAATPAEVVVWEMWGD